MKPDSNDVLSTRIGALVESLNRIELALERMEGKFITKEEVALILQAHEAKSNARHQQIESEVSIIKKIGWTIIGSVGLYALNSFLHLFNFVIK